jgi:hypothetical protein
MWEGFDLVRMKVPEDLLRISDEPQENWVANLPDGLDYSRHQQLNDCREVMFFFKKPRQILCRSMKGSINHGHMQQRPTTCTWKEVATAKFYHGEERCRERIPHPAVLDLWEPSSQRRML